MTNDLPFSAPWVSPPGDTIKDLLGKRRMRLSELAGFLSGTVKDVNMLLEGKVPITPAIAHRLESAIGSPASFWMHREASYRSSLSRLAELNSTDAKAEWICSLPIADMVAFGWIPPLPRSTEKAAELCLKFFGEPDLISWKSTYLLTNQATAFRTSQTFKSEAAAVSAWLRRGEVEALSLDCRPWSSTEFTSALAEARSLTRCKDPAIFLPKLQSLCANAGVAMVIVKSPKGCRASGATQFLTPQKALLMLSFRYLSDDHFWFTFFHEAGHLLLHSEQSVIIEGVDAECAKQEEEANVFAADTLVPRAFREEMVRLRIDAHSIIRFARKMGVSPGIVVGQLQYEGRVAHSRMNRLKRRFCWDNN